MESSFNSIVRSVRITQILIEEGWQFIDEGYNEIKKVINKTTNEEVSFNNHVDFIVWLYEQKEEIE